MKSFSGRVAVITGAASGFGREFAHVGAALGMKLVLADIDETALAIAAEQLKSGGALVTSLRCDVSDAAQVQALADHAMNVFGSVHLLFNNAGVGCGGLLWENSEADWRWVLGVNLWGAIHGVRIFTPLMLSCAREDRGYEGHIVNTASVAGLVNAPLLGTYNVSKHAVVSLSETLHHDLRLIDAPVGASVLCPYYAQTGIAQSSRNRPEELRNATPLTASQKAMQTLTEKAVGAARTSARDIAEATFAAIRDGRFYIHSHTETPDALQQRMEEILSRENPSDPYRATPQIGELLKARLSGP